jgi:hypothetical protein
VAKIFFLTPLEGSNRRQNASMRPVSRPVQRTDMISSRNHVRVHKTLRVTPAMAANVNDWPWSLEELVERTSR